MAKDGILSSLISLTDVEGILVGHATDAEHGTGCTAVLCSGGFTPGVCIPGFAPGTRDLELMRPENTVSEVHGVYLGGGSAFGLAGAEGVVRFLVEREAGLTMPDARIPLVPGAVIYDLDSNRAPGRLPDAAMGYQAAKNASTAPVTGGRIGVGAGALCGRLFSLLSGWDAMSPGGLGSAGARIGNVVVAALAVVNCLGRVYDPDSGAWLAGGVDSQGRPLPEQIALQLMSGSVPSGNTTLVVVATNGVLDKIASNRVARMATAGMARAIRPAHLTMDGDVLFTLSRKTGPAANENLIGTLAADAVGRAIATAVG
jgi:L-aminopeptidase/D-esterase-like protein